MTSLVIGPGVVIGPGLIFENIPVIDISYLVVAGGGGGPTNGGGGGGAGGLLSNSISGVLGTYTIIVGAGGNGSGAGQGNQTAGNDSRILQTTANELYTPAGTTKLLGLQFNSGAITKTGTYTVTTTGAITYSNTTGGVQNSGYATGWSMGTNYLKIDQITTGAQCLGKTYVAWYKGTQTNAGGTYSPSIPIFGEPSNAVYWGLGISGGKICVANGGLNIGTASVNTGAWVCLAWVVKSGGTVDAYVNGSRELSNISVNTSYMGTAYIGNGYPYSDTAAPTALDAIQVIDAELTAAQVAEIASAGLASTTGVAVNVSATGGGAGIRPSGLTSEGSGGSGGGAGRAGDTTGGSGIAGQGYKGGDVSGNYGSAGGGGAGGVGQNMVSTSTAGAGGPGLQSSITGSAVYYAGGGGGSGYAGAGFTTPGAGGIGGGGAGGGINSAGTSGTTNTGGGGGAGSANGATQTAGGSGGSGVVIIRTATTATSTTGSPTITTDAGYNVYKFTSSGTITF